MPLPLLPSANNRPLSHQSSSTTTKSTTGFLERTNSIGGLKEGEVEEEEKLKEKFISSSKNKPLAWDTDLLTKSLRDYIGQLHARKVRSYLN